MGGGQGSSQGSLNAYLWFIDDIAMTDVWVVDEDLNLITSGQMASRDYNYADLPADADQVVKEVFSGKTTFSEGFSSLLSTPTLTVGTPIVVDGQVVGAGLLHTPVEGSEEATAAGIKILVVSVICALVLSVLTSVFLALAFTKPLKRMKNCAVSLAGGDYTVKTGVYQKDEIGALATAIDVLSERLEAARQENEKLDKLRRDFVANISNSCAHGEVMRVSLEALCDWVVSDPEHVKTTTANSQRKRVPGAPDQRLSGPVALQNMDFRMEMREYNICDILSDAARSASQLAREKKLRFSTMRRAVVAENGDYGRLRQIFFDHPGQRGEVLARGRKHHVVAG
jgi:HAMP domain-containing protein